MRQAPNAQRGDPVARIAALVQSTLLLKEALALLPSLGAALEPATSELLKAVRASCYARFVHTGVEGIVRLPTLLACAMFRH